MSGLLYVLLSAVIILVFNSSVTQQRIGYNPLQLAVYRTEFLRGPFLHKFHRRCIEPEQKAFVLRLFLVHAY